MRKMVFSLSIATLLSGCMSLAPDYQQPNLPVATYINATGTEVAVDESYRQDWQNFVLLPELKALISLALEHNRDLHIALANLEKYRALYRIESSARFPTVDIEGDAIHQRTPGSLTATQQAQTNHQYQIGGAMQFELDFFSRLSNLSEAALNRYLMTESAEKTIRLLVIGDLVEAYTQYQAALKKKLLAEKTWRGREDDALLQKHRYELGLITELAMQQAEQSAAESLVQYEQAQIDQKQIYHRLGLLVGTALPESLAEVDLYEAWFSGELFAEGLPSAVLLARPDVQEKEYQLMAANADIGAARAAFFPSIQLTGFAGSLSADLSSLLSGGSGAWSFLPQLSLPIFNAGRNKAALAVATAEQKMAIAEYEKTIQVAFKEVADQLVVQSHIEQQLTAQKRSYVAAKKTVELSQLRYDLGADSYLQVLEAQRTSYRTEKELIDIAQAKQLTIMQLYLALGGHVEKNG